MRQLKLVPSGAQAWHRDTIAAANDCFAYSSTMALHVFRLRDMSLQKMIAAHERAITAICWSPEDNNLLASCSVSGRVAIWDLENEEERYAAKVESPPMLMDWFGDRIVMALDNGDIKSWEFREAERQTKLFSVEKSSARVLRIHPRVASRLVVGDANGALTIFDRAGNKKSVIVGKSKTSKDPVTDVQWDPLSEDYFLAAFGDGSLTLYDAGSQAEVHSFDKQAQAVKALAWAWAQPGNFVTCTERVGLLKLWNVSQRAPLSQVKVGPCGVNNIKAIPSHPNWFVLSFKNSAVGVCDIASRSIKFMSSPGHSETIFDVVFHPEDPDTLATASYDGHLKFWRISTTECHRDMFAGKEQLLYGLSFGPKATRVCAVSNAGVLFVWRCDTGEQVLRLQVHAAQSYRCEWNIRGRQEGQGLIASGGADNFACITDAASGTVVRRIQHPDAVFGVQWHPSQDGILATACMDGVVRLFSLPAAGGGESLPPLVQLSGHSARVFNLAFHPICKSVLASGSDDKTIRVWSWPQGSSRELRRLSGHSANVRGLVWHTELPHILFSGSWDSTIRVWDVAAQRCLHVAHEHHADVYGLALHPARPFFLASSSRDTTLRFWIFEDEVRPLLVQAVMRPGRISELLGTSPEEAEKALLASPNQVPTAPLKLYGAESREMAAAAARLFAENPLSLQLFQKVISFFLYRAGLEDLWGLLASMRGERLPGGTAGRRVFHEMDLIQCQKSKALELASSRAAVGVTDKQEERLLKAAQIMLRVGDLRQYCRLTAQAGQWERAICIAPAVSQEFWQELCNEYVDSISASTDLEEVAPYWLAAGHSSMLVDAYIERNELDNAFVLAKAEADGLLPGGQQASSAGQQLPHAVSRSRLQDVATGLSQRYSDMGEPVQAAMVFLAVSDTPKAVHALSRAQEVVLAYVVANLLGQVVDPSLLMLLALCAERDNRWDVAAEILQSHPRGQDYHLPLLAARAPDKRAAQAWCPWTAEHYRAQLPELLGSAAVLAAVCAGEHQRAAQLGVEGLHALLATHGWGVEQAREFLDPLESLPLQDMQVKEIAAILACSAYVGLAEAEVLGYHELMFPLAQTLRNIVSHQNLPFPVSMAEVTLMEARSTSWQNPQHASRTLSALLQAPELPDHLRQACQQLLGEIRDRPAGAQPAVQGLAKIAGGQLPSCYKRFAKTSVLTNQLIRGPAFGLEDHQSWISLVDALAWGRVNRFSPLNTGCKIYPL